jgi:hypothetical protein
VILLLSIKDDVYVPEVVIAAVAALVDDRHADAVDALATVTTEGTPT